ncbi:tetrahydrofolate dehydrogenase/cyclohydrolase catalytic domain-containing protein [Clostridium thermobutyricum]|uniref:Bifunctional protein FolD n=1 Tax=Clostridium thermobutyricum DSM 4928 TaxID=1121339 RepID=A0A1V4SV49_9CLOT|nr:tetrahydrofolate dehydrogenase/cyclohydrolase catalytic domain-containing protein [Clostridium thermobutyricum]OPX47873.1 bifunctional protein FolD protein [Clostridium thermobutyricum DSM 4928]
MKDIIDGRKVSLEIKEEIKNFVLNRKKANKSIPKIASILIGNDEGSIYYQNSQEKVATSLGVEFLKIKLDEKITEENVIKEIYRLNNDNSISGIMILLPLPKGLNEKNIVNAISPKKDIDCLTYESVGKLYLGEETFIPCTPESILTLLKSYNVQLEGKEVVIIGRSNIVGKPAFQLLLNQNATVTICHSKTKNLQEICKRADVLIVAIGKPKFINSNYIKRGAVLIDVGTSSYEGKITGDIDFENVKDKAALITPVPGGVGALTTTLLIRNSCKALENSED